jgi:ribosomal protein S18 acetylase RimI-like enzyme
MMTTSTTLHHRHHFLGVVPSSSSSDTNRRILRTTITPRATNASSGKKKKEDSSEDHEEPNNKMNKSSWSGWNSANSSSSSSSNGERPLSVNRAIRTFAGNAARTMMVASSKGGGSASLLSLGTSSQGTKSSNARKSANSSNNNAKKNITNNNRLNALSVEENDVVATSEEEETRTEKGMAFIAKITNGSIVPSGGLNSTNSSGSKLLEKEEEAKKTFSSGGRNKGDQIIGRDNVRIATSEDDFEVVANLRATAFYDDLTERQALPFPPRFTPTFHREFAQRERKALAERVVRPTSACAKCVCLVADDSGEYLVVERLRNSSSAVIGCLDVSIRHNPQSSSTRYQSTAAGVVNTNDSINRYNSGPKTETFVYVDNVAVARRARRRGAAKALLEAASNEAISWGAREMFTHVHCENAAARRLYHAYGFRACVPEVEENVLTGRGEGEGEDGVTTMTTTMASISTGNRFGRLAGLVMIRAPLPLKRKKEDVPSSESCDCGFEMIEEIDECVCGKSSCKDPSKRLISL